MTEYAAFLRQHPELREEAEQMAGRFEFEDGKKRDTAEALTLWSIKEKYKLWGK